MIDWIKVGKQQPPVSNALNIERVLVFVPELVQHGRPKTDGIKIGWYFENAEQWYVDGHAGWKVTHFALLTPPTVKN